MMFYEASEQLFSSIILKYNISLLLHSSDSVHQFSECFFFLHENATVFFLKKNFLRAYLFVNDNYTSDQSLKYENCSLGTICSVICSAQKIT